MESIPPYTLYTCPCSDVPTVPNSKPTHAPTSADSPEEHNDDQTLDPYSPRSAYTLYPLDALLFCNECHEIRCPRCSYQEVMYYYCPGCLLETQSNAVKQETNRCGRSCSQCPICTSPLQLQAYPDPSQPAHDPRDSRSSTDKSGPFILTCPFCAYSTLDIGITLEKSININSQLRRIFSPDSTNDELDAPRSSRLASTTSADDVFGTQLDASTPTSTSPTPEEAKPTDAFDALSRFYRDQIDVTTPSTLGPGGSYGLDSPSQLSRLLSTYGVGALKKQRGRVPVMREALFSHEGLVSAPSASDEEATLQALEAAGFEGTASGTQQLRQQTSEFAAPTADARLISSLRPVPMELRSKRAKRCRTCRHNLLRPDEKRQGSLRFKIRLLALAYIPSLAISSLTGAWGSTPGWPLAGSVPAMPMLERGKPNHFKLTFRNPLYDAVHLTLATPGKAATDAARTTEAKVTILCPTFEVGATTDAWSEALEGADEKEKRSSRGGEIAAVEGAAPEAGKVWARGRNWTSVVLEVVPDSTNGKEGTGAMEIPIFVRMEYETDEAAAEGLASGDGKKDKAGGKERKVKRELAYWCVVGVGKLAAL